MEMYVFTYLALFYQHLGRFQILDTEIYIFMNYDIPTGEWLAEEGPSVFKGTRESPVSHIAREEGAFGPPVHNTLRGKDVFANSLYFLHMKEFTCGI